MPQSRGPGHSSLDARSKAASSPPPLPRVAFLASPPVHYTAQQQRKRFPLVGGLQSELDNDEAYVILEDTLKRTGRVGNGHAQDVYARQVAWRARVEAKAEAMRADMQQEEISECTFRPKSAKRSKSQLPDVSPSC